MSDSSVPNPCYDPSGELELSNLLVNSNISSDNISNNQSIEVIEIMAPPTFDVKNLCILLNFDGNPNEPYDFIKVASTLLNHYWHRVNTGCIQNILLLQGIISKLIGRAEEVVCYGCDNWDSIKNTLIQNFGDQRDENSLTRDLVNLRRFPNESPIQFYEKCMGLLNTICNYIDLHHDDAALKRSKKEFFQQQTLTTFLAGLKEPLATIRAMRLPNLSSAIQYIQEGNNIRYLQRNHGPPQIQTANRNPMPTMTHLFSRQRMPTYATNFGPISYANKTPRPFPQGPMNIPPRHNPPAQRFFTNQQVFEKPQNVGATRNNPNNPSISQQPKPTPMSVSTRNTGPLTQNRRQSQNFQNFRSQPQQGPNFTSEELFNIEQYDQYIGETSTSHENLGHFPENAPPEDYTEEPLEYVQEGYDGNFHQEDEYIPKT
ncbi:hypothetical protein JTB14_029549 [Gonioctena quinquepunctata]|nr:hypothetical protein JTB14_029549 [Gonioctena quinquepunctata]